MASERSGRRGLALGAVALVLLALLLLLLRRTDAGRVPEREEPEPEVTRREAVELSEPRAEDEAPAEEEAAEPEPELPTPARESEPRPRGDVAVRGRGAGPHELALDVTVLDAFDHPLPSAVVFAAPALHPLVRVGETDAEGRFELRFRAHVPQVDLVWAATTEEGGWSGLRRAELRAGAVSEARVALPGARAFEAAWRASQGREAPARPTDWEELERVLEETGVDPRATHALLASTAPELLRDEDGAPLFSRIPRDPDGFDAFWAGFIERRRAREAAREAKEAVVAAGGSALVRGRVTRPGDEPARRALVAVGPEAGVGSRGAFTDDDGRFVLDGLPAGTWHARAGGGDEGLATTFGTLFAGEERSWDFVLDRGVELEGELLDARGSPLAGWRVELLGGTALESWNDFATTARDGRFAIPNVGRGARRLAVHRPDTALALSLATADVGDPTRFLTVGVAPEALGALVVECEEDQVVRVWSVGADRGAYFEEPPGDRRLLVGAGDYVVEAGDPERGWAARSVQAEAGREVRATPRLPAGGAVAWLPPALPRSTAEVRAIGRRYGGLRYRLIELRRDVNSLVFDQNARPAGRLPLPAGEYELVFVRGEIPVARVPFTVEDGRETSVPVPLPP